MWSRKKANPLNDYDNHRGDLDHLHDYMLRDEIEDESYPLVVLGEAHNETLADMKEQLLEAVNKRKGKVLKIALNIFNKVQDTHLSSVRLESTSTSSSTSTQDENQATVSPSEVSQQLQRYSLLLNDPRSPILSAIETIAQYKGDKGVPSFHKLYRDLDDILTNRIDLEGLQREQKQLEDVTNEVLKSQQTLKSIQQYLIKEQQEINKEMVAATSESGEAADSADRKVSEALEKRIKQMYTEFQNVAKKNGSSAENFSREDKLGLMRDVLSVEFGRKEFAGSEGVFPAFYGQDLIVFGL